MRRAACVGVLFAGFVGAGVGGAETNSRSLTCADRLEVTLLTMLDRPLLKEEHATAIMWLRMTAAEAEAVGNEADCIANVEVVETLLGLGSDAE